MLLDLARTHPRVAVGFLIGTETRMLPLARVLDAISNRRRSFFGARARDITVLDSRNFDVKIDAVEQRPGNSLAVTLDLDRATAALAFQIAEVSARTGIHRGDEHKLGR